MYVYTKANETCRRVFDVELTMHFSVTYYTLLNHFKGEVRVQTNNYRALTTWAGDVW